MQFTEESISEQSVVAYQFVLVSSEYLDMKRSLDSYKTKLQIQTKAMDEMTKEKDSQISSLMMENEKLLKEKVSLKVEVASLTEENQEVKKQRTH